MIDTGAGPPLVIIPGIDGRCERLRSTIVELSAQCRVISFSLCGERSSGLRIDPAAGFDSYVRQVDAALDRAGVERAAICGISYGGYIAVRYAAVRPGRTTALIIVATPGPRWKPDRRTQVCMRAPHLLLPWFLAQQPGNFRGELASAFSSRRARLMFKLAQLRSVLAAPFSPTRMVERVRLAASIDFLRECARVTAPTLVVTGEPALDRIVPVEGTREYARAIAGARLVTLERTGHLGFGTRPEEFRRLVCGFLTETAAAGREGVASARWARDLPATRQEMDMDLSHGAEPRQA